MTGQPRDPRPRYDELPVTPGAPPGAAWGLWGEGDEVGTVNLLTPERVAAAAKLARRGVCFPLNWEMELPSPPFFGRETTRHEIKRRRSVVHDDVYREFNPQSSSHWDGLTHYGNVAHDCFYGGVRREEITGKAGTRNGIQAWARRGIAGRGVLLDWSRWADERGIAYAPGERHEISVADLRAVAAAQGTTFAVGDILIVRSGWIRWYLTLDRAAREVAATPPYTAIGVAQGEDTLRFLWDAGFAAVVGDAPAFEAFPAHPERGFMHETILALWGMPIGEMFFLEDLAADCAADRVYDFFFAAAPLNKLGGVASPSNALAFK
jgi:hypothetical protein